MVSDPSSDYFISEDPSEYQEELEEEITTYKIMSFGSLSQHVGKH